MGCCKIHSWEEKTEITTSSSQESPLSSLSLVEINLYFPEKINPAPSLDDLKKYQIEKESNIKNIFITEFKKQKKF